MLYLTKTFIEMHGGSIEVKSEFGKGSEFIVELPTIVMQNKDKDIINEVHIPQANMLDIIKIEFSDIY